MRKFLIAAIAVLGLSGCVSPIPDLTMDVDDSFRDFRYSWQSGARSAFSVKLVEHEGSVAYCGVRTNTATLTQFIDRWAADQTLRHRSQVIVRSLTSLPRYTPSDPHETDGLLARCFETDIPWEGRYEFSSPLTIASDNNSGYRR